MDAFKQSVNWSVPDTVNQVNRLGQKMALEALQSYIPRRKHGTWDIPRQTASAEVAETFRSLLSRSKALPVYLPELDRYLLDYPEAGSENIQSEFYWEKVNFGLKPTASDRAGYCLSRSALYGPGLRDRREAALREPLLRDRS